MAQSYTNLDAMWLSTHAEGFDPRSPEENAIRARLLRIAGNLQRLDEQNQALASNNSYEQGYAAAEARMRRRSNILTNPEDEDAEGSAIISQINARVASGRVQKVPLGERALDDAPDKFNARKRAGSAKAKPLPDIDLDLSVLDNL